MKRAGVVLATGVLSSSLVLAATEMRLELRFTPKENVTASVPATDLADPTRLIAVVPLIDARQLKDLSVVGENREHRTPRPIRATSSLAEFATEALRTCIAEWGVRLGQGDLVLKGEITNLFVTEEQTYSTAATIRFKLEDSAGKVVWEGIASGDAHQWGRSFAAENYNEEISDALKKTFASLVSNPGFQKAWSGTVAGSGSIRVPPPEAKAKILSMLSSGVSEDVVLAYLLGVRIDPALTPGEIVDWKKSGISDAIIRVAVAGK